MFNKLKVYLQYLIPQHTISRLCGKLANSRKCSWLRNKIISWFIKRYGVDMSIAVEPDPRQYPTFNAFFTRQLQPAARPICHESTAIVSPVDGIISQIGSLQQDTILQAKNFNYSVASLLGDQEDAARFYNGKFATLYLSPKDYHRVHMPTAGKLLKMRYIPGKLFSVNPITVAAIPKLFSRNERVVTIFQTEYGLMAVVMIGAIIVAGIRTVWAGRVAPASSKDCYFYDYTKQNITLDKAAELGQFELGSTVVVLFQENTVAWKTTLQSNSQVCFGEKIGVK